MPEDTFDVSNVRIFKEIEKKKIGDVYTLLCHRSSELCKVLGIGNLCYSKISVVMLRGYMISGIGNSFLQKRYRAIHYFFQTIDADISLHFSLFNYMYHSFGIN